jgi:hypothetical protein
MLCAGFSRSERPGGGGVECEELSGLVGLDGSDHMAWDSRSKRSVYGLRGLQDSVGIERMAKRYFTAAPS